MSDTPSLMNASVAELIALGAAVAGNCEPCFRFHYDAARRLGVSRIDMMRAVDIGLQVKQAPHRKVMETVQRYLPSESASPEACGCGSTGCC